MKKNILTFGIICSVLYTSFAQPGSLDSTFSSDGKVITAIGSNDDYGNSVAIQSDGKIVVAGYSSINSGYDFALVRYNTDGNLDNTFGSGGIVLTDFGSSTDMANSIVIQADGKIVVAGKGSLLYTDNPGYYDFALARYNTDGTMDNTFGTGGKVLTDFGNSSSDFGYSAAIQSDGKIVVGGYTDNGSGFDFALVRYNNNGTLDNSFDSDGKVIIDFSGARDIIYSVVIQGDGKIVVAGSSDGGSNSDFALVRYNSDGTLDNSFDNDGKVITDFGSIYDYGHSASIQGDGKIVVAGQTYNAASGYDFALARYNSDGSLDNTFDADGKVITDFGVSTSDMGSEVVIQNDGKIVVVGESSSGSMSSSDFALVRYNSDGTLDNTFGANGKVITDFGAPLYGDYANSVALQSDGKIVVVGEKGQNFSSTNFVWDIILARYNNSGLAGIEESNSNELDIKIFPNPSPGIFTLSLKSKTAAMKICITDALGNCLLIKNYQNETNPTIDLIDQPKGIYFMEIVSGSEKVMKKIILE